MKTDASNNLIARYIFAVSKRVAPKLRTEVQRELESLISDMLDERCGDILPTDKDIRIVLMELGTPDELAAKYVGEEHQALISGMYYFAYKRVLKIVVLIVALVVFFSGCLAIGLEGVTDPLALFIRVMQLIGGIFAGSFIAAAIVTLVFAILERSNEPLDGGDFFSSLPYPPQESNEIKPYEPISGIVFVVIITVILLGFPQIIALWRENAPSVPLFNTEVLRSLWAPIVIMAIACITGEVFRLIEKHHTWRLAVVTFFVNLICLISAAIVFLDDSILNPEYLQSIGTSVNGEFALAILTNIPLIVFGVMALAAVLSCVVACVKANVNYETKVKPTITSSLRQ
jgi:hypothetical protein